MIQQSDLPPAVATDAEALGSLLERLVEGRQLGAIAMSVHQSGRPAATLAMPKVDQSAGVATVARE